MAGNDQEWTVGRLINWTADYFKSKDMDDPTLSAQLLLAKVLNCSKVDLYLRFAEVVDQARRDEFRELVKRAAEAEPIAYLVGHKEFFSLDFIVNRAVLIPRPETELLVQWVVRKARADRAEPLEILDVGTGSGCIAIALVKFLPIAPNVIAVDRSPQALEVARENAARIQAAPRIEFRTGDLFSTLEPGKTFDFIVSNPSYVTQNDYDGLPKTIKDYEPRDALVAGADGLDVIRPLVRDAQNFLKPDGYLVMEIGYNQSEAATKLLEEHGYTEVALERDMADVPRVVIGKK